MMPLRYAMSIALVAGLAFAGASTAAETMKHSGSVVTVHEPSGTLVMHEVGPWMVRDGKTVLTTLTITLTADTEFAMASRATPEVPGTLGAFVERPIGAWALYAGDFVTVDCRHEGKRLIATKVTVTYVPAD
jgi:hypothetical protein